MVTQDQDLFLGFHCLLIPCGLKGGQAPVELGLGTALLLIVAVVRKTLLINCGNGRIF
jgi:hypothetical protein